MSELNFKNWEVKIKNPDMVIESSEGRICKMALHEDIKRLAARADLIAAAPDLLEAAEKLINALDNYAPVEECDSAEKELKEAIKKARGEDD